MNFSLTGHERRAQTLFVLPVALLLSALMLFGFAANASADETDFTADQRKEYFDSGKYDQDLTYVADRARQWIIERTQPTIKIVRACKAKGFAIGKPDPGVDPTADYSIPVPVPASRMPDKIVSAPKPGPGPVTNPRSPKIKYGKAKKAKRINKERCGNLPKLAIAMDMDETAASSYRYGSDAPDYGASEGTHLVLGTQTALPQMLGVYKLALRRGLSAFIITARPDAGTLPDVTAKNLNDIGYTALAGVYLKNPPLFSDKGLIKNSQRAEITKRRGYKLIAMFGDQNSDLRTGFYERGFKYQSAVTPVQD